jgi:hypothetical protein
MELEILIAQAIFLKEGNKEFALFHAGPDTWYAWIGNLSPVTRLGETEGEFEGAGKTAAKAVLNLLEKLKQ